MQFRYDLIALERLNKKTGSSAETNDPV